MEKLVFFLSALLWTGSADLLSARDRTPELIVGTYNIRNDTPVDGENAWPYRKEKVEALIQFYGYDVLGVQEARPHQVADLRAMPGFSSVGRGRDGDRGGEFSAILYRTDRIQVLDSGTFWLSPTPEAVSKGWDAQLNRICTWAKMKDRRSGRMFYFFNTHFDHIGREARRESAALLAERIGTIAGEKYPVLCTGDFNSHAADEPIVRMKESLHDAKEVSLGPPYGPGFSYAGFAVEVPERLRAKSPIDYLFVNDRVEVLRIGLLTDSDGRFYPSDHFPIRAEVRMK